MTQPPSGPSGLFIGLDGEGQAAQQIAAPLLDNEIADIIAAFASAATTAQELGFDGVEIHGAHGYLIDQFFWPRTNRRDDRYGARGAAATRFASEVIAACRAATAPDFPIFFRWSQWKQQDYSAVLADTPKELEKMLTPLVDAGADLLHVSLRRYWEPAFVGSELTLAGWTRKLSGLPVCTVGSVGLDRAVDASDRPGASHPAQTSASAVAIDRLERLFEQGEFDLFAVGRALIADPAWAAKVRDGRFSEIHPYCADCLRELR